MQNYIMKSFKILTIISVMAVLTLVFVHCDREDLYTTAEKLIEEQNGECDPSNHDDNLCCDGEDTDSGDCGCSSYSKQTDCLNDGDCTWNGTYCEDGTIG